MRPKKTKKQNSLYRSRTGTIWEKCGPRDFDQILVQTWPEEYDLSLAKREGRSESGASFLAIWDEKQAIVFDKQFQQLRQELWGEQSEQIENEVLQQMEDAKRAIRSYLKLKVLLQFLLHIMLPLTHAKFLFKEELLG